MTMTSPMRMPMMTMKMETEMKTKMEIERKRKKRNKRKIKMKMKMKIKILASLGEGALRNIRPPPTFNAGGPYGTIPPPPYATLGALRLFRVKE